MSEYQKRNIPLPAFLLGKYGQSAMHEDELTLRVSRDDLFDPNVMLPHLELNKKVYLTVNQFVGKYMGEKLTLTLYCDHASDALQDTFREAYRAHYEDEYRKISRYLNRRYNKVLILIIVSVAAYYLGRFLSVRLDDSYDFLLNALSNVGVFCIWEIGYTHFDRSAAKEEKKRIHRAMNAEIQFL